MAERRIHKCLGQGIVWGIILSLMVMGGVVDDAAAEEGITITHYDQINVENWDRAVYRGIRVADMVEAFDEGGRRGLLQFARKHGMGYKDLRFYQMAGETARIERSANRYAASADRHAASADRRAANADRLAREADALEKQAETIKKRTDQKFQRGLEMLRQ